MAEPTAEGAAGWPATCGRPIDLLFIDASHTLANVYRDYHGWLRWLAPGGWVLFHDYDRPERVPVAACRAAWRGIGLGLERLRRTSFDGWSVLGVPDARGRLLAFLLGLEDAAWRPALSPGEEPESLLIFERPLSEAALALVRRGAKRVWLLDDLLFDYLLHSALRARRDDLLARTGSRGEFFRWEEYLEMLDHSCPQPNLEALFDAEGLSLGGLSRRCARELLRLAFLERIAQAILGEPRPAQLSGTR